MNDLLAVNLAGLLQSLLCFAVFATLVSLAVWTTIKEMKLKQGIEIPLDEVPQTIHDTAQRLTPNLEIETVIVKYRKKDVPRKYEFHGMIDGKEAEVEVMPREEPPFVREMEVTYDKAYRRLEQRQGVKLSKVPPRVTQAAIEHLESIGAEVKQIDRSRTGTIFDETAYELKGDWTGGRFEIKVLASSGEIVKVELKNRSESAD